MKAVLSALLIGCLAYAGVWIYTLVWGQPLLFNFFVERVLVKKVLGDPEFLTYLGLFDNSIVDFHSGSLTDISYDQNIKASRETVDSLKMLHQYDRARLSLQEQMTYDMLDQCLANMIELESFGYGSVFGFLPYPIPYPVNQLMGMQNEWPTFMMSAHQIVSRRSAEHYVARLIAWKIKCGQLIEELKLRQYHGVVPPRFVLESVIAEIDQFIGVPIEENVLYIHFHEKVEGLEISSREKIKLDAQAEVAMQESVYPAYQELRSFLQEQLLVATDEDGVWKFPRGDEYYAFCLKVHTTTHLSAQEIHEMGLKEVARIQAEMRLVLDELGMQEQGVIEAMKSLAQDPRFLYPDSDEGREELVANFHKIFADVEGKLPALFSKMPRTALEIERVPAFKEKTAPIAYYEPPSLNGSRPGLFCINTYNIKNLTKFTMPSLAYHEGIPGHHFQIALALEMKGVPTFRKVAFFTAYQEGWALYCEQLMWEYHAYTDLYSNLGRLQLELWRAVRLVVDTGIHYKRWNRAKAIKYMIDSTGKNESDAVSEIERYIVLPGQACSYKIGMIKILELRERMRTVLGPAFDIREFHNIILENGALPLDILEARLEDHIKQKINKS